MTLRAIGIGRTLKASSPLHPMGSRAMSAGVAQRTRRVRLGREADGWVDVPIHDAPALAAGATLVGPTLVDGRDTTVWVPPGVTATLDVHGTLVMSVDATVVAAPTPVAAAADRPREEQA